MRDRPIVREQWETGRIKGGLQVIIDSIITNENDWIAISTLFWLNVLFLFAITIVGNILSDIAIEFKWKNYKLHLNNGRSFDSRNQLCIWFLIIALSSAII